MSILIIGSKVSKSDVLQQYDQKIGNSHRDELMQKANVAKNASFCFLV